MKRILECETLVALIATGLILSAPSAGALASVTVNANATSEQIQAALDGLPDSGGEVVLPPGVFLVRQPIVLKRSHQILRGAGPCTILRLADRANCPVIVMGQALNSPTLTLTNLHVTDLVIDGNRRQQQEECWQIQGEGSWIRNNGITVQGVTDSTIERVCAGHCRSGGLVTTYYVRRLTVRDFEAYDSEFDGLACYRTEDSLFTGLNLHHNQAAGISFDLAVNHNVIQDSVLAENDLGVFMRDSRFNLFRGIRVNESRKFGVFMAQADQWTSKGYEMIANSECTNNNFRELSISRSGSAAFRVNDASCIDNQIASSHFFDNTEGGLSQVVPNLVNAEFQILP
jgi:polygalacturonase